jgi:hypothetical protein
MLRIFSAAIFLLVSTGSDASELGGRLVSVLLPLQPHQTIAFAVSPDRQTVYAVTWWVPGPEHPVPDASLHVIRVSDPANPVPVAEIPLGDFSVQDIVARGSRLFVLARAQSPNTSIVVVDLRNEHSPAAIDRLPVDGYQLNVAQDAACFAIGRFGGSPDALGSYFVDPSGKVETQPCTGLEPVPQLGGTELVLDRRGTDSLVWSPGGRLFIRTSIGSSAVEHGIYAPGNSISDAKFLASGDIIAAVIRDTSSPQAPGRLVSLNGGVLAFDAPRLQQANAALMEEYERLRASASDGVPASTFDSLASRLGDAGATEALDKPSDQVNQLSLVPVLNNFGFWQSHGTSPAAAIPTLQRVVEIAPTRAVAWSNLGDAARASLSGGMPDAERARLTKLAVNAYGTYQKLTGHTEPEMADFVEFNSFNAPHEDVCQFVAEYYSRGRQREISGIAQPVDVDGSAQKVNLDVQFGGSLVIPYVRVTSSDGIELPSEPAFGLGSTEANAGGMNNIAFIPFGGAVYAVTETGGAPIALNDWAGKQVCHFTARYTASIRQSVDDTVCHDLLAGSFSPVPPTTTLSEPKATSIAADSAESFWSDINGEGIASVSDIDLSESGHSDRVGSFTGYHPHGDCHMGGVVLMDSDQPQASARNKALLNTEWDLQDCRDASASVVRNHGHPYVEIDSGLLRHNEIARRTLLSVTTTGVKTICRIVERPTYTGPPH